MRNLLKMMSMKKILTVLMRVGNLEVIEVMI